MPQSALSASLDSISSVQDVEQLRLLESCLHSMHPKDLQDFERAAIFRVFERFPEHDAFGLFSALLHKLEGSPNYEAELLDSVRRVPTEVNLEMIARLVRGGVAEVREVSLLAVLNEVASSQAAPEPVRKYAQETLAALGGRRGAA